MSREEKEAGSGRRPSTPESWSEKWKEFSDREKMAIAAVGVGSAVAIPLIVLGALHKKEALEGLNSVKEFLATPLSSSTPDFQVWTLMLMVTAVAGLAYLGYKNKDSLKDLLSFSSENPTDNVRQPLASHPPSDQVDEERVDAPNYTPTRGSGGAS